MINVVHNKSYTALPFNEKEILRYAGCKSADSNVSVLLANCLEEVTDKLKYKVCWCQLAVTVQQDICDFGYFTTESKNLATNLRDCSSVLIFAATVGIELDRLIAKYGRISPAKAVMLQAIGAERIETLCNCFCDDISSAMKVSLKPRFSPGYGDLPLQTQRDIFAVTDCTKQIGISLNDSLLMSPSKSVTAFVGIVDKKI